jgi:phage replication-related protein YjqB (UPF0714/DUF867 family)
MADTFASFEELSEHEVAGVDYGIRLRQARAPFALVAPHGGGIEPGTSEIADAVADERHSFYAFEGLKPAGNAVLHITSTRFDEPMALTLVARSTVVVTIHGQHGEAERDGVFVGGLAYELGLQVGAALRSKGFDAGSHSDPRLQGRDPDNICNRGTSGAGVQLELSRTVRLEMFESLSTEGRKHTTQRFGDFVEAVRTALETP